MGFFSAVGDFLGSAGGFLGDVASGVLGLVGNKNTNDKSASLAQQQIAYQKELAQNQIQWRVEDAKKAGLHPMAALGLQSTSFSPVSANFQSPDYSFLSSMGQNAGYAAVKAKDRQAQAEAVKLAQEQAMLQTENMELQNEGLRTENEYRQWQLMTAMSGGTNQALNSSANASTKQRNLVDGQSDSPISGNTFSPGTGPLMSLSRMGDTLVAHVDPDRSDALTEDFLKNLAVQLSFQQGSYVGKFGREVAKHFTPSEQKALANKDAHLLVVPGVGWRLVWDKKFRPKYSEDRREVSGKLNRY